MSRRRCAPWQEEDHHPVLPLGTKCAEYTTTSNEAFNDVYRVQDPGKFNRTGAQKIARPKAPWAVDDDDQNEQTTEEKANENQPPMQTTQDRPPLPQERFGKRVFKEPMVKEDPDGTTGLPFPRRYPESGVRLQTEDVPSSESMLSRYSKRPECVSGSSRIEDGKYDPIPARYQSRNAGDYGAFDEEHAKLMRGYNPSTNTGRKNSSFAEEDDQDGDDPDYYGIGNVLHTPYGRTDDRTMERIRRRQDKESHKRVTDEVGQSYTTSQRNFRNFTGEEVSQIRNLSRPFNHNRDGAVVNTSEKDGSAASSRKTVMRDEYAPFDVEKMKMARANFGVNNKSKQTSQILLG